MADFLFVSQEMLDNWMMQGKIDFSGNVMTIRGDRRSYVLEPAVRFVKVAGEDPDAPGLLGKVKTLEQIADAGGEHYHDSVLVDDTAYDVQNGFVARVRLAEEAATPQPAGKEVAPEVVDPGRPRPAEAAPAEAASAADEAPDTHDHTASPDEEDEAALLTRFLLDNLR